MLAVLKDEHSLGYYRRIAGSIEPPRIFETLSVVKQLSHEGRITKSRGAAFVSMIDRKKWEPRTAGLAESQRTDPQQLQAVATRYFLGRRSGRTLTSAGRR
jgi:hypothetical protein